MYDFLTYDGLEHTPFATVRENASKTISVYSFGKLFNCTGWKIGAAIGPPGLIHEMAIMNDSINFQFNAPGQAAIAKAFSQLNEPY